MAMQRWKQFLCRGVGVMGCLLAVSGGLYAVHGCSQAQTASESFVDAGSDLAHGPEDLTSAGDLTSIAMDFAPPSGQNGALLWWRVTASADVDETTAVATASDGDVFAVGVYSKPITVNGTTYPCAGVDDAFVMKVAPSGTIRWFKTISTSSSDQAVSVAADSQGGVYVVGRISSPFDFGGGRLTPSGNTDVFWAHYDASGAYLGAQLIGGNSEDSVTSVRTDSSGNVLISGWFDSTTLQVGGTMLTNTGSFTHQSFVAKLTAMGTTLWAKSFGGPYDDQMNGVTTDGSGNVFITGEFKGSIDLGKGTLSTTVVTESDAYLAKLSGAGVTEWAIRAGGTGQDRGVAVATDRMGNLYATGSYNSQISFGGSTLSNGGTYVVKLSSGGTQQWAESGTRQDTLTIRALTVDPFDQAVIVGEFIGAIQLGSNMLNTGGFTVPQVVVKKYGPSGQSVWCRQLGDPNFASRGRDVAADASGNLYLGGASVNPNFGSGQLGVSGVGLDSVLIKLAP